jgi:hypothetical protein
VLKLAEEALDEVALAVERLAEAGFPFAVGFGRDVGDRALGFDQRADAIGVVGFVAEDDGARREPVKQAMRGGSVVRLACGQAKPDG